MEASGSALGDSLPLEEADAHRDAHRPNAKAQRYDRQLRLWAASGQTRLENACVFIGPASATASQILKNMVLPGVGSFVLCDPDSVTASDLGHNFFLESSSLGHNRAEEVARLLMELNPEVKGKGVARSLVDVTSSGNFEDRQGATIVIAVDAAEEDEVTLSDRCWSGKVPLLIARTNGFLGSLRVQAEEMTVVETHPESLVDLRLDAPFPALSDYVKSFDFAALNSHDHGHVPAVVIIIHFLERFKSEHGGALPNAADGRQKLKSMITNEKRSSDEENFDEALGMVWKACRPTEIPGAVAGILNDPAAKTVHKDSTTFWILAHALREFVDSPANPQRFLPLSGVLPDMKADTQRYVGMQNVYRQKAKDDLVLFKQQVHRVLKSASLPLDTIADGEIETFAKHAGALRVLRGRKLTDEYASPSGLVSLVQAEPDPLSGATTASYYLALRAAARFRRAHARHPGTAPADADGQADFPALLCLANDIWAQAGGAKGLGVPETVHDACREIARSAGTDLPQIAALIGGVVAQEAIKIITSQYIPLDGTVVFDGIRSTTGVLRL